MEVWDHDGKLYEVNSFYSLPDDAWQYELVGLTGAPGTGPYLVITIPDATPDDGPFTPLPASKATFSAHGNDVPWPILRRFIDLVEGSGDLVDESDPRGQGDSSTHEGGSPSPRRQPGIGDQ